MDVETLGRGLSYVNWTVLFALAFGSVTAVIALRLRTDVTRGYASFTAICGALFGILALLADLGLPDPAGLAIRPAGAETVVPIRRVLLLAFVLLSLVWAVTARPERRRPWLAAAVVASGVATAVVAALGWGGGPIDGAPLLVQILALTAATGGVFAALVLGHWYLVTPKLSQRPLILASRGMLIVVALQALLFATWLVVGTGQDPRPFVALTGPSAVLVWLRLIVGIGFPLALSWMALVTARSRSMESATGLLYINAAAIASGTIAAAALAVGSGLLV